MSPVDLRRLLARSALVGCVLMATIVASSAFMRLSAAGLGCSDWPSCYGRIREPSAGAPGLHLPDATLGVRIARAAHRISAMLAGVLVLFTFAVSVQRSVRSFHNLALSTALILMTLVLAVLGRYTAGTLIPAVALTNLAGGYGMMLLFWSLFSANRARTAYARPTPRWLRAIGSLTFLLAVTQVLLGGLLSTKFGALSCIDLPSCLSTFGVPGAFEHALDPSAPLALDPSGRVVPGADAAAVNALHRTGAIVVVVAALALAISLVLVTHRPWCGAMLTMIVAVQSIAGWSLIGMQFSLQLALLHNALGLALLMCIVTALHCDSDRPNYSTPAT